MLSVITRCFQKFSIVQENFQKCCWANWFSRKLKKNSGTPELAQNFPESLQKFKQLLTQRAFWKLRDHFTKTTNVQIFLWAYQTSQKFNTERFKEFTENKTIFKDLYQSNCNFSKVEQTPCKFVGPASNTRTPSLYPFDVPTKTTT